MSMVGPYMQELAQFPGREAGLRAIGRFATYDTLFYRSSVFSHSKRVAWLVETLVPQIRERLGSDFDTSRAVATALVHDDAELITGDIQAGNKSKMTAEQLALIEADERMAIDDLCERMPKTVGGYVYRELLIDVLDLVRPEAQVAKYLDRFDALGEALHEVYAGNAVINRRVVNQYGEIPTPVESYQTKLPSMIATLPTLGLLAGTHVFFSVPTKVEWSDVVAEGRPHTLESLNLATGQPQYDAWRKAIMSLGDAEEISNLYTQKEHKKTA